MTKTSNKSVFLVILFTFLVTIGQVLIKKGAVNSFFDPLLFLGLVIYGIATIIFIIALKEGELSVLYPLISLGFVWVTISSVIFLNETISVTKLIGISLIILGVAILGVKK